MTSRSPLSSNLRVFVYGTLKRGYANHRRYCQDVTAVQEAVVRGCLYELPEGFPILWVPDGSVLGEGTADAMHDLRLQDEVSAATAVPEECGYISGELLYFPDAATTLPALDYLEDFHAGGPMLYRRVLVPVVLDEAVTVAWTYVVPELRPHHQRLSMSVWGKAKDPGVPGWLP